MLIGVMMQMDLKVVILRDGGQSQKVMYICNDLAYIILLQQNVCIGEQRNRSLGEGGG